MSGTSGPAHRVQSAAMEYGFPSGHLGHLSDQEERKLRDFKKLVIQKGLYKPQTDEHEYGTHDDAMLLRFLRARRFDINGALEQFSDTEKWRAANQIDVLYETIDLEHYDETRRLYPQWTGRRDKRGIPVYVFEVKHLNSKTMAAYEKSANKTDTKAKSDGKTSGKLMRLFALYENLVRYTLPLSSAMTDRDSPRTPITQSNNIVDISGVGLKQFWNLRAHMQDASTLATAHYPETLDRIFIIGAPSFFPTVWGWVKRWFDPITTSKIFILNQQDMNKVLHQLIEHENIPKQYGGALDFKFGDAGPNLDPAVKELLQFENGHTEIPAGPLFWVDRDDKIELKAVGTINGKQRRENIAFLPKKVQLASLEDNSRPTTSATNQSVAKENGTHSSNSLAVPTQQYGHSSRSSEFEEPVEPTEAEYAAADAKAVAEGRTAVQEGEIIPASRPEPVSFVTARDDLKNLSLDDVKKNLPNGTGGPHVVAAEEAGPHKIAIANVLDPAVNTDGSVTLEKAMASS